MDSLVKYLINSIIKPKIKKGGGGFRTTSGRLKAKRLCYSDNLSLVGLEKSQNQQKNKNTLNSLNFQLGAFSLIELIIVTTTLAILGTITFIALQGFAANARDAKRITDVKSLIDKVNIEQTKGVPLSSLIAEATTHDTKINGQSNNSGTYQGIINFETIKEDQKNFQDPLTKTNYPFAYTEGITQVNGESKSYKFTQMGTINERNGTTQLVGNYFKYDKQDDESLLISTNGNPVENGEPPMIYGPNNGNQSNTENPPTTYSNCFSQTINGYNAPATNHGNTTPTLSKSTDNGIKSTTFTCNDGTFQQGEENVVCNENYVNQGGNCVQGQCNGNLPDNAVSNATQQAGETWTYNETAGNCTFECENGYNYANGTNECNPKTQTVTNATYNEKTFTFTSFILVYGIPQTKTSNALSITNGTSTLTATFTLEADGTTIILSNASEAITCSTGYHSTDGITCIQNPNDSLLGVIESSLGAESTPLPSGAQNLTINGVTYSVNITYFEDDVTYASNQNFTTTTDGPMVINIYKKNLTINAGVTIQPSVRTKGMLLYVAGTLTNNGTITMTARGACATGQNIYLWKNANNTYETVPAAGASQFYNATSYNSSNKNRFVGGAGYSGTNRQTGAGGGGGAYFGTAESSTSISNAGQGGAGTSYSGGGGGGGYYDQNYSSAQTSWGGNNSASANGCAGGSALARSTSTTTQPSWGIGGGAGNPGGTSLSKGNYMGYNGSDGAGGLIIIYANNVVNAGSITANGMSGGRGSYNSTSYNSNHIGGGGSGGGSINIFYRNSYSNTKTITVTGGSGGSGEYSSSQSGAGGGSGGNGSITITKITN